MSHFLVIPECDSGSRFLLCRKKESGIPDRVRDDGRKDRNMAFPVKRSRYHAVRLLSGQSDFKADGIIRRLGNRGTRSAVSEGEDHEIS